MIWTYSICVVVVLFVMVCVMLRVIGIVLHFGFVTDVFSCVVLCSGVW